MSRTGTYALTAFAAGGVITLARGEEMPPGHIHDPVGWQILLSNVLVSIVWLPVRFFVGRGWLASGEEKLRDSAWMDGGAALQGYWQQAVTIPGRGRPPITHAWFRDFLQYMLDHAWCTGSPS